MKSMNKKRGVKYGNVEIPGDAFESQNVKLKVTAYLDLDIVHALKEKAKVSGTKYQTLMNQLLRETLFGKTVDSNLRNVIREVVKEELSKAS